MANARTFASLLVNAPSLNTGCEKRLVVAIEQRMPVSDMVRLLAKTILKERERYCMRGKAASVNHRDQPQRTQRKEERMEHLTFPPSVPSVSSVVDVCRIFVRKPHLARNFVKVMRFPT